MGKGLVLVGMGTIIGLTTGFAIERLMNSMLFNAGGVDILAYLVIVPSLFLVTMLAAYVPARRASRISADAGAAIRVVSLGLLRLRGRSVREPKMGLGRRLVGHLPVDEV